MSINWNEKEFEEIFIEAVREALNWLEYYLYCLPPIQDRFPIFLSTFAIVVLVFLTRLF